MKKKNEDITAPTFRLRRRFFVDIKVRMARAPESIHSHERRWDRGKEKEDEKRERENRIPENPDSKGEHRKNG